MAAFRLLDQCPQYRDDEGNIVADGELRFYETGTTTPKNVTNGSGGASLGSTVALDSSGRPETDKDPWLDGIYRVRLYDADDALVWSRDNVQEAATGGITPLDPADGTEDQVYSTDGVNAEWRSISEVPSQTGHSGKFLTTDGTVASWGTVTIPTYDADSLPGGITQDNDSSGSITIGNIRIEWGNDTAPTSASVLSTKAVTFHTAFSGTPYYVGVTPTSGGVTSDTPSARCSAQALSANSTGFTASLFAGAEDEGSGSTAITSTVGFNWLAIGPK